MNTCVPLILTKINKETTQLIKYLKIIKYTSSNRLFIQLSCFITNICL